MPKGYGIVRLRRLEEVQEFTSDENPQHPKLELPCNYSVLKVLAGIVQIISGSVTLYLSSRGEQLATLGGGAFTLTVIPYVLMSLMNSLASLSCPEYPTMFLVESEIMDEARRRGGFITGTVGCVKDLESDDGISNEKSLVRSA